VTAFCVVALEVHGDCFAWIYNVRAKGIVSGGVASLEAEVATNFQVTGKLGRFEVIFLGWAVNLHF
jgi:hypothetical protein